MFLQLLTVLSGVVLIAKRVLNPTVDLAKIVMMYVIDPLGSPYDSSTNALAFIGGEQSNYSGGSTLNNFIDEVWPRGSSVRIFKAPRAAVTGFGSSIDGYQNSRYEWLCGKNCRRDKGIPGVWLAQPAFQKYRTLTTANICLSRTIL